MDATVGMEAAGMSVIGCLGSRHSADEIGKGGRLTQGVVDMISEELTAVNMAIDSNTQAKYKSTKTRCAHEARG